jgi:hypothetical protein
MPELTHIWYWRSRLPERKGQACHVLARGSMNSVLVQFADGYLVITSRYAVRRRKPGHESLEQASIHHEKANESTSR